MWKKVVLGGVLVLLCVGSVWAASSFSNAFQIGDWYIESERDERGYVTMSARTGGFIRGKEQAYGIIVGLIWIEESQFNYAIPYFLVADSQAGVWMRVKQEPVQILVNGETYSIATEMLGKDDILYVTSQIVAQKLVWCLSQAETVEVQMTAIFRGKEEVVVAPVSVRGIKELLERYADFFNL